MDPTKTIYMVFLLYKLLYLSMELNQDYTVCFSTKFIQFLSVVQSIDYIHIQTVL